MKISSVRIENFKSLADTGELELGQVNILVGRNNHGKSAFIRALLYMQQSQGFDPGDVRLDQQESTVNLTLAADDVADIKRHFNPEIGSPILKLRMTIGRHLNGGVAIAKADPPTQGFGRLQPQEPNNFIYTYLSKRKVFGFDREVNLGRTLAVQTDLRNLVAKVSRLANSDYERAEEYAQLCKAVLVS